MKNKLVIVFAFCCIVFTFISQDEYFIIPQVSNITYSKGLLNINNINIVDSKNKFIDEQKYLFNQLNRNNKFNLDIKKVNKSNIVNINLISNASLNDTEYKVIIDKSGVQLISKNGEGIFYAIQTFLQMIESVESNFFPYVEINDIAKFKWRGMHLDVCRHFFSVDEVKQYIDILARYKLNTFHWHLTDDQGWRIEIKKYPKLTEVGAWRNGTMVGHYNDNKIDSIRYGGFYTQDEIKDVVKYANERYINVVPEIEMPGHALAALSAYPELSCNGGSYEVAKTWGVFDDVFCAGNENTFKFLEDILSEVCELFPSEIIHIGGDECPKNRWKSCEKCQNKIKQEDLKDEHELQSYFIQRIEKFLLTKGKKIIGWDEILEGGLAPNAYVMSWRGSEGGIAAAKMKHYVVMSPGKPCYFDHYQQKDTKNEPIAIGGLNTLEDVYNYYPIPSELIGDEKKYILGAQANLWTEYILNFNHLQYMLLPRMTALSEVLWTEQKNKNYNSFINRLKIHRKYFDKNGLNYNKSFGLIEIRNNEK